jgi:hypothetical protein
MPSDQKCFSGDDTMTNTPRLLAAALVWTLISLFPALLRAEDAIEKAGVAVGVTAGNLWFLPIKAITVTIGHLSGALSYVVTGGNTELTQQIWQDTTEGPYLITPELARKSIGRRPELEDIK